MFCRRIACAGLFCWAIACWPQPAPAGPSPLELSIEKAIAIALSPQGDERVRIAEQQQRFQTAQSLLAHAPLLPDLAGSVTEQNQTVNPRALGLRFTNRNFSVPKEAGPFYTFDARLRLTQNILNLSAIRQWQATHADTRAASDATASVRQKTAAAVARVYTAALRADAQVEAANANLADAIALRDLALHRLAAGEGTELDASRGRLNESRAREKLLSAQADRTRAQLQLIDSLRLDWTTILHLTTSITSLRPKSYDAAACVAAALQSRADLKEARERVQGAQLRQSAAGLERAPSLTGFADYGVLEGVNTHTAGASLRVPLFDGGRMEADRTQANALRREEDLRAQQLKHQAELEVRLALASLSPAAERIQVADDSVSLAEEELARARRRYDAGLANSEEVSGAEAQLAQARYDRVETYFTYASARIDLAEAMGAAESLHF